MKNKSANKILTFTLAVIMTAGMVAATSPVTVQAAIGIGGDFNGKPWDGVDFDPLTEPSNGIYYGTYDHAESLQNGQTGAATYEGINRPILWSVMGEEASDGKITLMSKYALDSLVFSNSSNSGACYYIDSSIRSWLNGAFLNNFASAESEGMTKTDVVTGMYDGNGIDIVGSHTWNGYTYINPLPWTATGDKVYLPWGIFSNNKVYWTAGNDTSSTPLSDINVTLKSGKGVEWRLRTPSPGMTDYAGAVTWGGGVTNGVVVYYWVGNLYGIRPVFKLNPESVIFASEIKSSADTTKGETAADANYAAAPALAKNYKLTVVGGNSGADVGTLTGVPTSAQSTTGTSLNLTGLTASQTGTDYTINYKIVAAGTPRTIVGYGFTAASGTSLAIDTSGLSVNGSYDVYVWLQKNNALNSHEGTTPTNFALSIAPDTTAPSIVTLSPANGAQNVTTGAALTVTFDEAVEIDSGNIKIFKASDTVNPVYTVTSPGTLGLISPQSGANASYTITPSSALEADTDYYVTIDSTFFKDAASNYFAGIANATTWAFKTAAAPVTLTLDALTNDTATEGVVFSKTLSVTYTGIGTLGYSATGLPLGLSINTATGEISGTPDVGESAGSPYTVNVGVTDGSLSDSGSFTLTVQTAIVPQPVLTLTPATLSTGTVNSAYSANIAGYASGGTSPYSFAVTGGSLPAGLNLSLTGTISGTPTAAVTNHSFTVTVTDSANDTASASYTITINSVYVPPYHGGSDNDSYTPPVIWPVVVTVKLDFPTTVRLTLTTAPDKNNTLTATITKEMVQQALDKAKEEAKKQGRESYGYSLEFYSSTDKTISGMNITFDADALALLESAGIKETSVITNSFRFGFDLAAIKELNKQSGGKAVTVSASRFSKLSDAAKRLIGSRPAWDVIINFKKDGKTYNITNLGKGTITMGIKYTPASGEKTGNIIGVYVPGSGTPQTLTSSSYDNGWLNLIRSGLSVYGVGYITPAPAFTDTANHWAKDNIDFVASRGLISGTTSTTFAPDTAITRADFLMALGKLSGANVSGYTTSSFTDVQSTSAAMPYIEWAVKNGIVQGIGNNQFGPDNKITREDMAVMMVNYAKATDYKIPVAREKVTFADDSSISAYAKDAVVVIQQAGIITGRGNNMYAPKANATRAEASTILRRFVELVIDEGTARSWVQNDAGQWQYINTYGKAVTSNWLTAGENKYWFDANGVMVSGKWLQIEGKWYYFDSDGKLAVNTTIDGYTVGADGARK